MTLDPRKDPNQTFMMRLGKGEKELRILLQDRAQPAPTTQDAANSIQRTQESQGQIMHRDFEDKFIIPKKKRGLINFYNLGYIKDVGTGLFSDLPFWATQWQQEMDGSITTYGIEEQAMPLRDYLVFSVPYDDWKDRFKKFEFETAKRYKTQLALDTYSIDFDSDPEWTENGLKLSPAQLSSNIILLADTGGPELPSPFSQIQFKIVIEGIGSFRNHITETLDPTASESSGFSLSGELDIFLMPEIFFSNAVTRSIQTSPPSVAPVKDQVLNRSFHGFPNLVRLDPANIYADMDVAAREFDNVSGADISDYNEINFHLDFHKGLIGGGRADERVQDGMGGGIDYYPIGSSLFPASETMPPPNPANSVDPEIVLDLFSKQSTTRNDCLLAVVFKGSQKFYIWSEVVSL